MGTGGSKQTKGASKPHLWGSPPTRSVRVHWLLSELGVDFDVTPVDFMGGEMHTQEFRKICPVGTVPAYRDSETAMIETESGAMMEFILAKYGKHSKLVPSKNSPEYPMYLHWFWFAEGMAMPTLTRVIQNTIILPEEKRTPWIAEEAKVAVLMHLGLYEKHFVTTGNKYLIGNTLTCADIMNIQNLFLTVKFVPVLTAEAFPKTYAYFELLCTHENMRKAYSPLLDSA